MPYRCYFVAGLFGGDDRLLWYLDGERAGEHVVFCLNLRLGVLTRGVDRLEDGFFEEVERLA